jgi:hypothetical protein
MRPSANPVVVASTVFVTWACATALDDPKTSSKEPDSGAGGSSSGSTQNGKSGGPPQNNGGSVAQAGSTAQAGAGQAGSAGSAAPSGGSPAGGQSGAGGAAPLGGGGGSPAEGGSNAVAGSATAGSSTSGGADAAGGVPSVGGSATAGSSTSGGTGAAGIPNDPNWMPPDMVDTAKIVVLYQCQQTATTSTNVSMTLSLRNQTDAAYNLSDVTIRYWMSSEPSPRLNIYYSSAGLSAAAPRYVTNMANSYVEFRFGAAGTVPAYVDQNSLNQGQIQAAVEANIDVRFNQANDWSFDGAAMQARPNPKITVYDGDTLIWGCEPSHACASPDTPAGDAGAGGQSGS